MATTSFAQDFRSLSRQPPPDPDIQATLADFLTYTEHFPAHLTRALTLIGAQRRTTERHIAAIHRATTTYALLPTLHGEKAKPVQLRRDISHALEEAERACRMAVEEAARLDAMSDREAKRLDVVTETLKAQPLPPSRDATPEHHALTSPNLRREGRIGTRADDAKHDKTPKRHQESKAASKLRGRKIMVPGEVLPPPDPTAPVESVSDWTSPPPSPPFEGLPVPIPKPTPRPRSRTPKIPKVNRATRPAIKPRGPRQPGQPGTNAHSAVAGISTSNALLALKAPPEDAVNGSRWLPWLKLTEWEMAKLRKRMKKNAIWVPSLTMVRRELKNLGRGNAGKEAARALAQAGGEPFVDDAHEADPTKVEVTGEEAAQMNEMLGPQTIPEDDDADAELINRGMRLNEAKKLKRQKMLEEQAALNAQFAREQGVTLEGAGLAADDSKKRKRDSTPPTIDPDIMLRDTPDPLSKPGHVPKKLRLAPPSSTRLPLAPPGVSSSPRPTSSRVRKAATPPATGKRPSLTLKLAKAVSEEPPNHRRATLRRGSNVSLPNSSAAAALASPMHATSRPASGRRSKRPAPGLITNGDEGSAKVAGAKRKSAPRKKIHTAASAKPAAAVAPEPDPLDFSGGAGQDDLPIDPDEPRYCLCGDVSWGTMIACDSEECEREWFHLPCVGLEGMPPRRTRWYCPECRVKMGFGVGRNGLVGPGGR